MVMRISIRGRIFPKGGESDAEHPTVIPMDLPSSHQEPRGPMTRARARALENGVTSFLSDMTYDPLETWLLPKSNMLCMIRCQEDPHEDAREDGQAAKSMDEENQQKRASSPSRWPLKMSTTAAAQPSKCYTSRTSGPSPGHPAPAPDIRLLPKPRKSGPSPGHPAPRDRNYSSRTLKPGHPAPCYRTSRSFALQPGHPAPSPDIRPLPKPRTSGHLCLRTVRAEARVPLRPPRLYILLLLHLSRVSKVIAHLIESFAPCTTLLLREREGLLLLLEAKTSI